MRVEDVELSPQAVDDNFDATPVQQATGASSSTAQQPPPLPMTPLFKTTLDNNISPVYCKENPNLTVNDIKCQFYLRGIQVPKESEIQEELKHKGRGKARTHKQYLVDMILDTIDNGGWIVNLVIIEMVETEINNYIKKCYDCCHFKKENMELYKLNLPNGIVNHIIDYALGEEDECKICQEWRNNQELIRYHLNLERRNNRNVGDEILIFFTCV